MLDRNRILVVRNLNSIQKVSERGDHGPRDLLTRILVEEETPID